uniref:Protein kinase domain-containing protein n=1 Tax=Chlamydomonas euryale TaxID=1486919 RepID=A0A7R9YSF6_9CHLO|mmetsp:Transcript_17542/g.52730  ORF Transcript_17542/g.52730 Transcript_17542/m.52730 type:complete len:321 (+) Transcript_17542:1002-1964(+)|eukprot:363169-Chlamydomonas_euryale.AAC.48
MACGGCYSSSSLACFVHHSNSPSYLTDFLHMHAPRHSKCTILEAVDGNTLVPVVIKVYSTKDRDRWQQEVLALSQASKVPHVMRSVAVGEDEDQLYTTVTASTGISLIELMSGAVNCRLSEGECQDVMVQVVESIAGLHAAGVIHRHIKPEHVMCSNGGILLVDLSDAMLYGKNMCNSMQVGTLAYMAPELLMAAQADVFHTVLRQGMAEEDMLVYDDKVDVWAIGVMVFELLTGRQPFIAESSAELLDMQNIQCSRPGPYGKPDFIARELLSDGAKSFISDALQLNVAKRPSAASLLSHPWLLSDARRSSSSGISLLFT